MTVAIDHPEPNLAGHKRRSDCYQSYSSDHQSKHRNSLHPRYNLNQLRGHSHTSLLPSWLPQESRYPVWRGILGQHFSPGGHEHYFQNLSHQQCQNPTNPSQNHIQDLTLQP